jgi:acetyl-CoA carboxylase biotin carboxylase subunit
MLSITEEGDALFKRCLVANRGEIAIRVIRTLRDMGIESVAVYSDVDRESLHVSLADYAIRLEGQNSVDTYLNIPKLIECIQESFADAVHPGYGFLAENAAFAEAIARETKAKFIGPAPAAIRVMGDKIGARKLMKEKGVITVPGCDYALENLEELEKVVQQIGYPIILKAAGGGGGRGMRIVTRKEDLKESFDSCRREAGAAFGNPAVFCERYLQNPRHIEFQILCDKKGQGVHLFERECSIQRRHQKLFEEAPSVFLNQAQRRHYGAVALKVAQSVEYEGTGTIEFIGETPEQLYFMEMNTRIQVEHTVTEEITGIDIVAEQIRIAAGESLRWKQEDIRMQGWSMEARINAEDPAKGFIPQSGRITRLHFPSGPHVRVDSHLYVGYEVPLHYDSMLMKLITHGQTREEAAARMRRSLQELMIEGVPTTASFHEALLQHKDFLSGKMNTAFLEKEKEYFEEHLKFYVGKTPLDMSALLAALMTRV